MLLEARNSAVIEFVPRVWKRPGRAPRGLDDFATNHPDAAFRLLDEELALGRTEEDLLRAYALSVRENTLAAARTRLLGFAEQRARIAAVCAVNCLASRGFDMSGLEPILAAPIEALRADGHLVSRALHAIEYNEHVMWTPQVLDALRARASAATTRTGNS